MPCASWAAARRVGEPVWARPGSRLNVRLWALSLYHSFLLQSLLQPSNLRIRLLALYTIRLGSLSLYIYHSFLLQSLLQPSNLRIRLLALYTIRLGSLSLYIYHSFLLQSLLQPSNLRIQLLALYIIRICFNLCCSLPT